MSIIATKPEEKERKLPPAGTHVARVFRIIHIGTIKGSYNGQDKLMDKVRIGFELPNEMAVFKEGDEPKPFVIDEKYTLSMFQNARLRPIVEGIIGAQLEDHEADAFDVVDLMGRVCLLSIVHNKGKDGKTYANIATTAPLIKGMEEPPAINPTFLLDYTENWDNERFSSLPEFIRVEMSTTPEYKTKMGIKDIEYPEGPNPEDVPF